MSCYRGLVFCFIAQIRCRLLYTYCISLLSSLPAASITDNLTLSQLTLQLMFQPPSTPEQLTISTSLPSARAVQYFFSCPDIMPTIDRLYTRPVLPRSGNKPGQYVYIVKSVVYMYIHICTLDHIFWCSKAPCMHGHIYHCICLLYCSLTYLQY